MDSSVTPIRPYIVQSGRTARIYLQKFKKLLASLERGGSLSQHRLLAAKKTRKNKPYYRYKVTLRKVDNKKRYRKRRTSKRNRVTFRRLKPGKYQVRYRVQVVEKKKVVNQTNYSPSQGFSVNR